MKIHVHKPGAVPKDFSALPNFTTVNIAVGDKSKNKYIVLVLNVFINMFLLVKEVDLIL